MCPYCGKKYMSDEDPVPQEDDYWMNAQCERCGKDFKIQVHAIWRYETSPLEGWNKVEQPAPEKCDIPF